MSIVKVDHKGRILLPKQIRERIGIGEGDLVEIAIRNKEIVIKPFRRISERYYGVFRVQNWPDDLDTFISEAIRKWWKRSFT